MTKNNQDLICRIICLIFKGSAPQIQKRVAKYALNMWDEYDASTKNMCLL